MQQVSTGYANYIAQDSRTFQSRLIVDGKTIIIDGIKSIKLSGGSNSENDFSLGSAVSQYIEVNMSIPPVPLEGHEIEWQLGANIAGSMEWVPMGLFWVEKPEADEREVKFTAYDRMLKAERAYFSSLPQTTTTIAVLQEIAAFLKISIVTSGLSSIGMAKPVGYTCRETLSLIAQLYGGFAVCNRLGQIIIKNYAASGYKIAPARYWDSFKRNEFNYALQKLTCYTGKDKDGKDISISAGSGIREVAFSNPFMTQTVLNNVWSILKNYTYMPGSLKFLGDPRIDPWDVVTVIGTDNKAYQVPAMKLSQDFDGGLTTEIEAVGKTEAETESGFKGPSAQAQDRWVTQLAMIDHALINKLDVDTANINFAKIQDLEVVNQTVQNLKGEYGEFKELVAGDFKATNGHIEKLDVNYGNIVNLLSGNAGIGDLVNIHLTSENAVVDSLFVRNEIAKHITVNDLVAGTIFTNRFEIWSDESGGMKMYGATQQWTDGDGIIRMQAGLDANGEFNYYILDTAGNVMFDALGGIRSDGIKTPVITDKMVANNAAIKGSKVLIDETNQTLDIAFSNMTYNVANAENNALEAKNQVSSISSSLTDINLELGQIKEEIEGIVSNDGTYLLQLQVSVSSGKATIHARVYCKNAEVTQTFPSDRFLWSRRSEDAAGDTAWNAKQITGYSITLAGADIEMIATFQCLVTVPEEFNITTKDGNLITDMAGNDLLALTLQ